MSERNTELERLQKLLFERTENIKQYAAMLDSLVAALKQIRETADKELENLEKL